jgi:hypothetical protein
VGRSGHMTITDSGLSAACTSQTLRIVPLRSHRMPTRYVDSRDSTSSLSGSQPQWCYRTARAPNRV